jgi:hypothetical protein
VGRLNFVMKVKIKKAIMGDKPEQGTPAHEKHIAMISGKEIAMTDGLLKKKLENQIKGKWRK